MRETFNRIRYYHRPCEPREKRERLEIDLSLWMEKEERSDEPIFPCCNEDHVASGAFRSSNSTFHVDYPVRKSSTTQHRLATP
jgi:hypothetical protein